MMRAAAAVGVLLVAAGGAAGPGVRGRPAGRPAGPAAVATRYAGSFVAPDAGSVVPPDAGSMAARYESPVAAPLRVLRAFDPPRVLYGAGHLGVDLDAGSSRMVRAAAVGVVAFAGPVAGRGVVVIAHPDGIRTEYEPVQPLVRVGATVRAGEVIGTVAGRHRGCAVTTCLHWGARRGAVYLDPLALLRPLGPVRLLPWSSGP